MTKGISAITRKSIIFHVLIQLLRRYQQGFFCSCIMGRNRLQFFLNAIDIKGQMKTVIDECSFYLRPVHVFRCWLQTVPSWYLPVTKTIQQWINNRTFHTYKRSEKDFLVKALCYIPYCLRNKKTAKLDKQATVHIQLKDLQTHQSPSKSGSWLLLMWFQCPNAKRFGHQHDTTSFSLLSGPW